MDLPGSRVFGFFHTLASAGLLTSPPCPLALAIFASQAMLPSPCQGTMVGTRKRGFSELNYLACASPGTGRLRHGRCYRSRTPPEGRKVDGYSSS